MKPKPGVHLCLFDDECRKYGAPKRIYFNTPWFHFAVALTTGDRFVDRWGIGTHWTSFHRWREDE